MTLRSRCLFYSTSRRGSAEAGDLFVGVGGALHDNGTPDDFRDDRIVTDDAIGFAAYNGSRSAMS